MSLRVATLVLLAVLAAMVLLVACHTAMARPMCATADAELLVGAAADGAAHVYPGTEPTPVAGKINVWARAQDEKAQADYRQLRTPF